MSNLKELLLQSGYTGRSKADYKLGHGTRRLKNRNQVIWGNLLNGEWFKMPELTDQFLLACTRGPSTKCIEKYTAETGIDRGIFSELLRFVSLRGFIDTCGLEEDGIDGVEFLNITNTPQQEMTIQEIFQFRKVCICSRQEINEHETALTFEQWRNIFDKLRDHSIENLSLFLYENGANRQMEAIIPISREYFESLEVNLHVTAVENWKQTINSLAGSLLPEKDTVFLHIKPYNSLDNMDIEQFIRQIASPFQRKGITVKIGVPFQADPYQVKRLYAAAKESDLLLYYEFCSLDTDADFADIDWEYLCKSWYELIQQYDFEQNRPSMISSYFNILKLSCGAGRSSVAVSGSGSVYPCPSLMTEKFKIGSILCEDISDLERRAGELLVNTSVDKKAECQDCFISLFCGGGCLARAYSINGDHACKDPLCDFFINGPGLIPWYFDPELSYMENMQNLLKNVI